MESPADPENKDGQPKRKWKKKKTLLSNAKKYGKKECFGRGSKISEDMYHYFVGILEVMKNGFETDEEKENFVNNVLERTIEEEVTFSCNQLGCRIIEQLLPYASPEALERYIAAFSDQIRILSTDNFSSFVLEELLCVCCRRATQHLQTEPVAQDNEDESEEPPMKKVKAVKTETIQNTVSYPTDHVEKCHAFTIKVAKYLLNNLEDFVWDPSANRMLRTSIKCLGGVVSAPCEKPKQNLFGNKDPEQNNKNVNKHSMPLVYRQVPEEFKEIVKEHGSRLSQWPQFKDMPYETLTSGLLQMLVFALKNSSKKLFRTVIKKLLEESFAPDSWSNNSQDDDKKDIKDLENEEEDTSIKPLNLPPVFDSDPAVRLLEAVLHVARSKLYTQIYAKCFINRLAILSGMPGLNFTVQRLFDNSTVKEEFEPMFDELADKFDKILVSGNTGVLVAIVKACLRLQSKQVKFIQSMEQALGCSDAENHKHFAVLCARLLPLHRVDISKNSEPYFINIHGSVILQTMLGFQRPKRVIDSFLAMSPADLLILFCDAKGSHVADGFFEGQFVGAKSREVLVRKLRGTFQEFAVSKYGSRALEKIFKMSPFEQRVAIMEELADKSQILNSTLFGQVVANNLRVELYKKSFQSWKASLDKEDKAKAMFKDILEKK